jgi:hypothetical protein
MGLEEMMWIWQSREKIHAGLNSMALITLPADEKCLVLLIKSSDRLVKGIE